MSLISVYFHQSAFYPILVLLLMDGSVADKSTSCKPFPRPDTETAVFRDEGCFLLSRVARTWEESKTFCETLGKGWSLVVIEDVETQRHVDNLTLTAKISSDAWIGLRRQDNKYRWVSGNNLGLPDFFRELGEGENSPRGHCVITSPPEDNYGTWNYADCTTKHFTICHTSSADSLHRRTTATVQEIPTSTTTSPPTSTTTSPSTSTTTSPSTSTTTSPSTSTTTSPSTSTTTSPPTFTITSTTTRKTTPAKTQTTVKNETATLAKEVTSAPTSSSTRASEISVQAKPMTDATARTSTKPAVQTTTSIVTDNIVIPVTSGVAVVAALTVVGVVIILCRRNKTKRLRLGTFDAVAGDDRESGDVRTKPDVVYAAVTPRRERQTSQALRCDADPGYHYIPVGGEDPVVHDVTGQMYDTATGRQEKQQVTLDSTYDRAMFHQSGDDVYDHTCLNRKSPQAQATSHYDHAVVQ
ncbi:uncharacterized protein [Haliotis asinina]|uniref:uncharacterized protein isoform X2 n=1 Tax=Haliotis asinina TaxID=109174 RepID=UPI0035327D57